MVAASDLPINTGTSALQMAQENLGAGVAAVNADDPGTILATGKARDFTNCTGDTNHRPNTSIGTSGAATIPPSIRWPAPPRGMRSGILSMAGRYDTGEGRSWNMCA